MKFKVLGRKYYDYHTSVQAENKGQAYDIAEALSSDKWNEISNDEVIEVTDVFNEELDLIEEDTDVN